MLDEEVFNRGKRVRREVADLGDGRKLPIWFSQKEFDLKGAGLDLKLEA